jgi:CRISPR-associated endonuclease Csn1
MQVIIFKEENVKSKNIKYAFDLGTNSIGWAVFTTENNQVDGLLKTGVRIFSDGRAPKSKEPLAVSRRIARGSRRRRDRFLKRKMALIKKLIEIGLMPESESDRQKLKELNVYALRAKAINEKVEAHELGRALYHLNQRRGFKSNRKSDSKSDESKINAPKISSFHEHIQNNNLKTIGNYLYSLNLKKLPLRFNSESVFYPDRSLYENEFDTIISVQSQYYKNITSEDWAKLKQIIFFQRPLKVKTELIGKCELFTEEARYPKASPYFQRYRLLQSLANLKTINDKGEYGEIDIKDKISLYSILSSKKEMTFDAIRKKLKLGKEISFNLENIKSKKILGDEVSKELKEILEEEYSNKSLEELDQITMILLSNLSDEEIFNKLKNLDIHEDDIKELIEINLPDGYCYFSKKALDLLVPKLEELFCSPELIIRNIRGESIDSDLNKTLEYYGKILPASVVGANKNGKTNEEIYGKISNPTVHIALNQIRKVTNDLIKTYGIPSEIVVEVTRDLKNSKAKKDLIQKNQNENQRQNEKIKNIIISEHSIEKPSRDDITKYKLWLELGFNDPNDRKCPYSLKKIPASKLFSDEVEIEHILPFSRTLDDSISNKTLAYTSKNRSKGNSSPFEAFAKEVNHYESILENALKLPTNKKWRFLPNAMERYLNDNEFMARQLTDTAYIAKISKKYLETICKRVDVVPGKLTSLIRHHLGLNTILNTENFKDRENSNKHHAVDAIVIGITSRSYLQKVAKMSASGPLKIAIEPPFDGFRKSVQDSIDSLIVSRREDHGIEAQLHEETYYGIIGNGASDYEKEHDYNLVTRKTLESLKESNAKSIRSTQIRKLIEINGFEKTIVDLKNAGTKRLRYLKQDKSVEKIWHPYNKNLFNKGIIPGENHSLEIWKIPTCKNKFTSTHGHVIYEEDYILTFVVYSYFEKARKVLKRPHPAATKLFTLCNGDSVMFKDKQTKQFKLMSVKSIIPSGKHIAVVPLDSASRDNKVAQWPYFSSFKATELRKIHITPSGKILDPGNPYV